MRKVIIVAVLLNFWLAAAIFAQNESYNKDHIVVDVYKVNLKDPVEIKKRNLTAAELISNATTFVRNGRFNEAIQVLQTVLDQDPDNFDAQFMMADIYNENGTPEKSIAIYSNLLERDPKNYDLYNNRGYAYGRLGKNDIALEDYNKGLLIKPDATNILSNRAAAYFGSGQMDLAQKDYEHLIQFDEEQGNFGLGNIATSNMELEKALDYYNKTISISPEFPQAYVMKGQILLQLGDQQQAVEVFKKAKSLEFVLTEDLESALHQ
ncbi:MAG: tetratricopeptide repeat protein [Candidatus Omnitrophica bacterium]|nr:tetratricopeptide repeat protein [Candidatus Omnitrophota bacterium]